jgi:putative PEP-CTERM system histidine kinase
LLSKRLSRFKYDYREEWLKLIDNLSSTSMPLPLPGRAVMALAEILKSPGGLLFVREHDHEIYVPAAVWGLQDQPAMPWFELPQDELMSHMERNAWIVDTDEPLPPGIGKHFLSRLEEHLKFGAFIVPLLMQDRLFGFAILKKPADGYRLTYEDIDLLRTSGRQVASYLAQYYTSRRLAEVQQFEAYGRMTAFLMHDLKNIIAQQSLLVQNAVRHKHNPSFIDDALATIEKSVERMNRVLRQLRLGNHGAPSPTDLRRVVADAVERCRVFAPAPVLEAPLGAANVLADSESLVFGFTNVIRNAQQAASASGSVSVRMHCEPGAALIEIVDNGPGMSDAFITQRLFRPFDSTSPEMGMGLGAFQFRETVRLIGGTIAVKSAEGRGSLFQVRIPLLEQAQD